MIVAYRTLIVCFFLALLFLIPESTVLAADITVDEACTLAHAIAAANEDAAKGGCPAGNGADVISLTADVTLAASLPAIESVITVEGNGFAISGGLSHRIFVVGDTDFVLNHVVLMEGRSASGSAIFSLAGGTIIVNRSIIESNIGHSSMLDYGGAIRCHPCHLTINGSILRDNTSSGDGGAVYFNGWGDNYSLRIFNSHIEKNNAEHGGGLYVVTTDPHASAFISNVSFHDNWAAYSGGAIYHEAYESGGELFVSNSTFYGNHAWSGGALYTGKLARNTFSHVTFVKNDAGWGSSINAYGKTNLHNSIAVGGRNEECYGTLESSIGSLDSDASCDAFLRSNPMLGDLIKPADGSPSYYPLMPGSPAIDAVDCDRGITIDQIGTTRPQGARCDLGAIEFVQDSATDE